MQPRCAARWTFLQGQRSYRQVRQAKAAWADGTGRCVIFACCLLWVSLSRASCAAHVDHVPAMQLPPLPQLQQQAPMQLPGGSPAYDNLSAVVGALPSLGPLHAGERTALRGPAVPLMPVCKSRRRGRVTCHLLTLMCRHTAGNDYPEQQPVCRAARDVCGRVAQ